MSDQVSVSKVTSQTAQRMVLIKLIIFSLSLAIVPITTFFATQSYLFNGNATYAAIAAVFAANAVLIAYIVMSVLDDRQTTESDSQQKLDETRKER